MAVITRLHIVKEMAAHFFGSSADRIPASAIAHRLSTSVAAKVRANGVILAREIASSGEK